MEALYKDEAGVEFLIIVLFVDNVLVHLNSFFYEIFLLTSTEWRNNFTYLSLLQIYNFLHGCCLERSYFLEISFCGERF